MISVIKSTGEKEPFSEEKVLHSVKRIGIPENLQQEVVRHIMEKSYDGIRTSEIYHHIREFLGKKAPLAKAKFNLKHAIMDLGPTGYPFEDFISAILKTQGYQTLTRQILKGTCVSHEIDVVATKAGKKIGIEAKFHNISGLKTNLHVALYTKARFDDIKEKNGIDQMWLVTNTKITSDAIAYAHCSGVIVIGWDYPVGNSLKDMIEESKLIPITTLTSLSHSQKVQLVNDNIVVCQNLVAKPSSLQILNLSGEKEEEIMKEAEFVCST